MPRQLLSTVALVAIAAMIGACSSPRAIQRQAAIEPLSPAPTGRVTAEPLAPPPGAEPSGEPIPGEEGQAPPDGGGAVAAAEPPPVAPRAGSGGRSGVVGGWTATDASGSCRVSLSSSPSLDLYKATTSGCGNKELAKVSAWDYRDGEVYLYQPGGIVTARLKQAGASLDGTLAKSGAPLGLIR